MMRFLAIGVAVAIAAAYAPQFLQSAVESRQAKPSEPSVGTLAPAKPEPLPASHQVVLKAQRNGHFYTQAQINHRPIQVMVDTGATVVALRAEDARALNIRPSAAAYNVRVRTANGVALVAPVTLRHVRIGAITVRNVQALVSRPGDLSVTLLGMAFLGKLSSVSMREGALTLEE